MFRLGEEEDAIGAKQNDFSRGGELIVDKLAVSWNERLAHERTKLVANLQAIHDHLRKAVNEIRVPVLDDGEHLADILEVWRVEKALKKRRNNTEELLVKILDDVGMSGNIESEMLPGDQCC